MKLGIFGGTFNPPHLGHLIVAEHVRTELSLDKILFVPAAQPPHKLQQGILDPKHRRAMLDLAIEGNSGFGVLDIELQRGGISFTVDTLRQLKQENPAGELYLLIGMDNLIEFHTWKAPQEILSLATVAVMTRPGFEAHNVPDLLKAHVSICEVPEIEIASREIRRRVAEGKSIRYLVTRSVRDYIKAKGLYRA